MKASQSLIPLQGRALLSIFLFPFFGFCAAFFFLPASILLLLLLLTLRGQLPYGVFFF
jgi:hypothetical protein